MSEVNPPEGSSNQPFGSVPPPPPPPPPPAPGTGSLGYGAAIGPAPASAGPGQHFDVGAAFSWAWKKFQENLSPLLIAMVIYVAIVGVITVVAYVVLGGLLLSTASIDSETGQISGGTGLFGVLFFAALMAAVFVLLFAFLQAAIVRGALMIADGHRLEVGSMFKFDNFGAVFVAALIVAGLTLLGVFAFYIGAFVVGFFTAFYLFFVVDKGLSPWASVVASFNLVKNNIGQVFLLLLAVYVLNAVGGMICGIGLIVTAPLGILAMAHAYRRLQNEPVAA